MWYSCVRLRSATNYLLCFLCVRGHVRAKCHPSARATPASGTSLFCCGGGGDRNTLTVLMYSCSPLLPCKNPTDRNSSRKQRAANVGHRNTGGTRRVRIPTSGSIRRFLGMIYFVSLIGTDVKQMRWNYFILVESREMKHALGKAQTDSNQSESQCQWFPFKIIISTLCLRASRLIAIVLWDFPQSVFKIFWENLRCWRSPPRKSCLFLAFVLIRRLQWAWILNTLSDNSSGQKSNNGLISVD